MLGNYKLRYLTIRGYYGGDSALMIYEMATNIMKANTYLINHSLDTGIDLCNQKRK